MKSSQELANDIKRIAKSQNVTIGKMLSDCGLSVNTLSSMQSGGYFPRLEAINKIADYLNCSIDYLLGRTDEPKTETSDPTTQILVEHFSNLSSDDKIDVLNMVLEKSKK